MQNTRKLALTRAIRDLRRRGMQVFPASHLKAVAR